MGGMSYNPPSTGGSSIGPNSGSSLGFFNYESTDPMFITTPEVWTPIPNNGLGIFSERGLGPDGVSDMLIPETGEVSLMDLVPGDQLYFRITIDIVPYTMALGLDFRAVLGQGLDEYTVPVGRAMTLGQGAGQGTGPFVADAQIFIRDANTISGGMRLEMKTDGQAEVTSLGLYLSVFKR